ncbi:MAG: hypothetical protein M1514_00850, partial [Patescibacteria group bacterium]|nr:hypothetical protein [Patescibacteria group bacterium]
LANADRFFFSEGNHTMIELAHVLPGEKVADLGSGDGRIVIELARLGAEAHGFEIEPKLALEAMKKIEEEEGFLGKAYIHLQDFFLADLSDYDLITGYWITSFMEPLEKKLQSELKPGARVVSNYFTFPNWKPEGEKGSVYVYKVQ